MHPEVYAKQVLNAREYSRNKNWKLKKRFVEMLGGKCQSCGFNNALVALQFHHKNPRDKWSKSTGSGYNEDPIRFEKDVLAGKIELICANCHWIRGTVEPKMHRSTFKYQQIKKNGS
jgi:5-methylcytosine-specific restriction endonuclease McrA